MRPIWSGLQRKPPVAIVIVAAVLGVALLTWVILSRSSVPPQPPSAPGVGAPGYSATMTPPAAGSASDAGKVAGECGDGQIRLIDGIFDLPASAHAAAGSYLSKLAAQLARATNPKDRALGLFMQRFNSPAVAAAVNRDTACEDAQCRDEIQRAFEQTARPYTDAIAQIATTTDQPDVYALALYACGPAGVAQAAGSCALLSAAQWARIEPGNAIPWFWVADAAVEHRDSATRDEALFRASKAAVFNPHWPAFADLFASDAIRSQPPDLQAAIGIAFTGIAAAMTLPGYKSVNMFCGAAAVSEPSRRQICSDLAELMTERSDTVFSLSVGAKLGERVGWPSDRLATLRDRRDALMQISAEKSSWISSRCVPFQTVQSSVIDGLRSNDTGAGRRAIAASGRSVAQLAQAWRAAHKPNIEQSQPSPTGGAPRSNLTP